MKDLVVIYRRDDEDVRIDTIPPGWPLPAEGSVIETKRGDMFVWPQNLWKWLPNGTLVIVVERWRMGEA